MTIEYITDNKDNPVRAATHVFETENRDNIQELAERHAFNDKQRSFPIGLKPFGKAMLEGRDNPLFKKLPPHFGAFMKSFKSARKADQ